jgi:hypothetical protein
LAFSSPPVFSVRQYGVIRRAPSASASSAACAAIQAKIPVVIGQAIVAPCFFASAFRRASIVVSLPSLTFFIAASTSRGAGITNVPRPHRFDIVASISATFGRSLSSASFSRQLFLARAFVAACLLMVISPGACDT